MGEPDVVSRVPVALHLDILLVASVSLVFYFVLFFPVILEFSNHVF